MRMQPAGLCKSIRASLFQKGCNHRVIKEYNLQFANRKLHTQLPTSAKIGGLTSNSVVVQATDALDIASAAPFVPRNMFHSRILPYPA